MGICTKLAVRSLRKNKGRTLITLSGIVLSVLMVCTVLTLLHSMLTSATRSVIERDGNWHIAVHHVTPEQVTALEAAEGVLSADMLSVGENTMCRILLKDPGEAYAFANRYLEGTAEYSYHTELLSFLGVSQNENVRSLITGIAAALLAIIAVGAIALIYNAFAISVAERTKELGLLSSLGAAKKDIRAMVYTEAFLLGTVAIPFGVGLGILTSFALLDGFGAYMEKILYVNMEMQLHISGWLLLLTVLFAYLLVFLSASAPARSAAKITIISNLKGDTGTLRVKDSNLTAPVEILLANRSRKREKKAFRAIILSLSVSIFLFVSANAFSIYMLSFTEAEQAKAGYDLRINCSMDPHAEEFDALYRFVQSQEGIDDIGWYAESTFRSHSVLLHAAWITDAYRDSDWAVPKGDGGFYKAPFYIFVISDERYAAFLTQNHLANDRTVYASAFYEETDGDGNSADYAMLKDGIYRADVRYMSEDASERLAQDINENPNDRLDYENYYDTFFSVSMTVGNYDFPSEFRAHSLGVNILIPESRMSEFQAEITNKEILIKSPNYADIQKNTADYAANIGLTEKISLFNSAESYESQRNLAAMIRLFSASFLALLTVISCANIFNIITTGLQMRKREFAVLRSMGMTVKRLFAMLCAEHLRNGLIAVLIGGAASLPMCYLLYHSIVIGAAIDFVFPFGAFAVSALVMILIMLLASLYGLYKIKNGNVSADMKNECV